jgi:hypothetical protein
MTMGCGTVKRSVRSIAMAKPYTEGMSFAYLSPLPQG